MMCVFLPGGDGDLAAMIDAELARAREESKREQEKEEKVKRVTHVRPWDRGKGETIVTHVRPWDRGKGEESDPREAVGQRQR